MHYSLRSVCRTILFFLPLLAIAAWSQAKLPVLVIESPIPYQVFQRQTEKQGDVVIRGHVGENADLATFDRMELHPGKGAAPIGGPCIELPAHLL